MEKLFIKALKKGFRFNYKGLLTVEDLWSLSLEQLDEIYKDINKKIKASSEESFLNKSDKTVNELNEKLEIVKYIMEDKLVAKSKREKAALIKTQKEAVARLLAEKKQSALSAKSEEELEAILNSLNETDDEE
jgi:hypothetical protein